MRILSERNPNQAAYRGPVQFAIAMNKSRRMRCVADIQQMGVLDEQKIFQKNNLKRNVQMKNLDADRIILTLTLRK
jgi:hypothetical protein